MNALDKALLEQFGTPTEKQDLFYKANTRYVGFGGARGGGKSHAARAKATYLAYEYPGIKMLFIRRTFPELRDNHILTLQSAYASFPRDDRPVWIADEKAFVYPGMSRLRMGYCDTEADVLQYRGQEYDVVFLEESTHLTDMQHDELDLCIRGVNGFPKRMYETCNPGEVGHSRVKRLYIDKKYHKNEKAKDYTFIKAQVWDNQPLFDADPGYQAAIKELKKKHRVLTPQMLKDAMWEADYVKRLANLPEDKRKAFLDGDWNTFVGQMFSEFDDEVHVCDPFPIPSYWTRYVAFDYGQDMFAPLWIAEDEYNNIVVYNELARPDLNVPNAATALLDENAKIQREYPGKVSAFLAPPDMWHRGSDTGVERAITFAANGVPLVKSGSSRIDGWARVKEYLMIRGGKPRTRIFNTCTNLIECMHQLQYDAKVVGDAAKEPHKITHHPDALRCFCSRWSMGTDRPMEPEKPDPWGMNEPEADEVTSDYLVGGFRN